jgi:hypothetical protein
MKDNLMAGAPTDADDASQILMRDTEKNKFVANKNFFLKDGIWVDSEIKDGSKLPVVEVKFGSDQYFELLKREPALGQYFALGEEVRVAYNGTVYNVSK